MSLDIINLYYNVFVLAKKLKISVRNYLFAKASTINIYLDWYSY